MSRRHGANKSILFAQILHPYEVAMSEFAQIKDDLFAHVYMALRERLHDFKKGLLSALIQRNLLNKAQSWSWKGVRFQLQVNALLCRFFYHVT